MKRCVRNHRGYVRKPMFSFDSEPILFLDGTIIADRLVVGITIAVPHAKMSIPAVEIVAFSAGGESAVTAAEDEFPTLILTDFTVPWQFASEVVVVAVDLQFLLELC